MPREYLAQWSPEQDAELTRLWNAKELSCSAIGSILGCSKNAVIGRAYRLKLEPKGQPTKVTMAKLIKKTRSDKGKPHNYPAYRIRKSKPVENDVPRPKPIPEFEGADIDLAALSGPAFQPLPDSIRIPLIKLNEHTCKWPVSGDDGPMLFCGCNAVEGSPYCATHKQRARGAGTVGEREAHRVKSKHLQVGEVA